MHAREPVTRAGARQARSQTAAGRLRARGRAARSVLESRIHPAVVAALLDVPAMPARPTLKVA
jgi:hypothetical protein